MIGIARSGFNTIGFRPIHCQHGTLAIAAKHEPRATRSPLRECSADDGLIGGRPRKKIESEVYILKKKELFGEFFAYFFTQEKKNNNIDRFFFFFFYSVF